MKHLCLAAPISLEAEMQEDDPISGVSFRNTKRHFRKKYGSVGKEGPRLPEPYPVFDGRKEVHIHPRSTRLELCGCGYPAKPCQLGTDERRNYCYKYNP